ncbi:hypothetical protein C8R45DRAFT_58824 [Mycena sanguinolenta]|nr:hypothetical protein C8R45DRAFT_58824 [Mycena sanguinolenta]
MSLTLLWHGATHYLESRPKVPGHGVCHRNARWESRINKNVHIVNTKLPSNPDDTAILKIARDAGEIAALELEAETYTTKLAGIQGKYVPDFYGIYHGIIEGYPVACMLLEYCVADVKLSLPETNRRLMLAACAIHSAGVRHCDLENSHHFVLSGPNIKIVDFGCAVPHTCYGATPCLHPGMGGPGPNSVGCEELEMLERKYGILSSAPFPTDRTIVLSRENPLRLLARRFV